MNRRPARAACLVAVPLLLAACSSSPPDTLYTLSPVIEDRTPEPVPRYVVEVAAVSVPDLVDRSQLVIRKSDNRVVQLEQQRWASPLTNQLLLVLAEDLARLLPEAQVKATGEAATGDVAYRVALDVQRFDSIPGQAAVFDGLWSLRRTVDGAVRTGRTTVRQPAGSDYESLVAAHARAVGDVSRAIAEAIRAAQAEQVSPPLATPGPGSPVANPVAVPRKPR